jgi:hypothetical protein
MPVLSPPRTGPPDLRLGVCENEAPDMEGFALAAAVASLESASFSLETIVWSSAEVSMLEVEVVEEDWLLFWHAIINTIMEEAKIEIRTKLFVFINN